MSLFADHCPGSFRRQHPYRNLEPPPGLVNDRDRAISPLRSAHDLKGRTIEWVKTVEDVDVRGFCTQGTVGVGVFILMSTALFPPAGSRSITPAGFALTRASFSPFPCSGRCFAASSSLGSSRRFSEASYTFPGIWRGSRNPNSSPPGCDRCFAKTGWSTPSHPSAAPSMCSSISAATPTVSPFPTIDWSRWPTGKSLFVGATPLTTTSRN